MSLRWCGGHRRGTRSAPLIAVGAFAVHQARYLLAYGGDMRLELAPPGHAYLELAAPILFGLAFALLAARLTSAVIAGPLGQARRPVSCVLGILAVFCSQELLEGVLFACHAPGLAAIFSAGGWAALPLAVVLGVLAAFIDRGIATVASLIAPEAPSWRSQGADSPAVAYDSLLAAPAARPLAFGLARRPPPCLA